MLFARIILQSRIQLLQNYPSPKFSQVKPTTTSGLAAMQACETAAKLFPPITYP